MKCPECGQWNRASMPHCTKCGAPLNIDEASKLQWKDTLKDGGPSTAYLRADEFGQVDSTPDARDQLAGEMQELKKRKREGEERKSRLSGKKRERPDSEVVVTEEPAPASRPRRARHDDMPMTAVRVQPASRNDQRRREESRRCFFARGWPQRRPTRRQSGRNRPPSWGRISHALRGTCRRRRWHG